MVMWQMLICLIFSVDEEAAVPECVYFLKFQRTMSDIDTKTSIEGAEPAHQVSHLFRQQAIDFVNTRQYGKVILPSYISHRILTCVFCIIIITIIAFFIFFKTARKAEISGVLLPSKGLTRVQAGQVGIVTQVLVKEGQKVRAGDVLFILSNERNIGSSHSAESTVSELLQNRRDSYRNELLKASQQSNYRALAVQKKAEALQEERDKLESQIVLQRSRVALMEKAFQRFQSLHTTNYISLAQLEEREGELLDQRQRLAELERLKGICERDFTSAQAESQDLQYQSQRDEAALKRNELAIRQDLAESEARREIQIVAPTTGKITAIAVEVSKPVSSDSILVSILPVDSELEAELYAPSRSVGFVKPGMTVLLRYQAYPYQKFGQYEAVVYEVADASMTLRELALSNTTVVSNNTSEPLYRIRLKLKQQSVLTYGKPVNLKPGMLVDASIILEHRRLYEWVLEPLFSITGRG